MILSSAPSLPALAQEEIKIGVIVPMSGPAAAFTLGTRFGFHSMQLWAEDLNKAGGLLKRPVRVVFYDNGSKPEAMPTILSTVIEHEKVNFTIAGYGSTLLEPAIQAARERRKLLIGLGAPDANRKLRYDKFFSVGALQPPAKEEHTRGLFEIAAAQKPRPVTVAVLTADAPFARDVAEGARQNAANYGFKLVHEEQYPLTETDFTRIVKDLKASAADIVVISSYPADSAAIVKAVTDATFKPKLIGGVMSGLRTTALRQDLGARLDGFLNYEAPPPSGLASPTFALAFIDKYRQRTGVESTTPALRNLYYGGMADFVALQILEQSIKEMQSLDDDKLAAFMRSQLFRTVMGEVGFGPDRHLLQRPPLLVQYRKAAERGAAVLTPEAYRTGDIVYPYENALK